MKLIVKYFFVAHYFWRVVLDFDKYMLPWQMCCFGGHHGLESSGIRVKVVHVGK